MSTFVLRSPFAAAQEFARTHLTLRGPRAYADTHDVALSLLAGAPGCRVIDIGAGRGELSARLARLGHQVTAIEKYTEQFEADVPLVEADADRELPFGDESVDAVMAVEILEHLENPRGFLRETWRVLKPVRSPPSASRRRSGTNAASASIATTDPARPRTGGAGNRFRSAAAAYMLKMSITPGRSQP